MNTKKLYSIRMHATRGGKHVSGAERIVTTDAVAGTLQELVARARGKSADPEQIRLTIDSLADMRVRTLKALDVVTLKAGDMHCGRSMASRVLRISGISLAAAEAAIRHLSKGAAPSGGNMRGAIIMDSNTGERLEPDQERGIRASRFDWSEEAALRVQKSLADIGLTHYRTREALALATKVAHAPGMVAELCWSDDPDYTAGYIASLRSGYVRIPFLKQPGDHKGGRVFFIDRDQLDMDLLIWYLQKEIVLIADVGDIKPTMEEAAFSMP